MSNSKYKLNTMNKITIQATVSADSKKAWDYYTSPAHITKWNFASDDWHCPNAENNMSVGGKYLARMEAKDGSFAFDFEAIYDEITPGKHFTFTMGDGRQVTVTFEDQGAETRVIVVFDPENENPLELQQEGWQMILNNYKKYTEGN